MKRINVAGIKLHQLQERGLIPENLKLVGELPPSYSIHIITGESTSIIACADGFGGGVAWARLDFIPKIIGKETPIDQEEIKFLQKNYPTLVEAIYNLV
ncbi:MAG: hypothetical protein L6Q29_03520 [Candidatus Pacebacteria bacterium]|nr:hypothetical protein [Candidatus Paceibacterota bacterium]NUQ57526.1 hypothetical protein [Candidatus Paceibacter sp.]